VANANALQLLDAARATPAPSR